MVASGGTWKYTKWCSKLIPAWFVSSSAFKAATTTDFAQNFDRKYPTLSNPQKNALVCQRGGGGGGAAFNEE